MTREKALRWSIGLQFAGFTLELVALLHLTPATFMVFLVVGLPLIGLGVLMYLWQVYRALRETQAL